MKRRILLVDDEVAVLLTLKAVLEISGFDVDTATSAREGKARIKHREYEMVITDMRMEGERAGEEVINAAKAAPYNPAVALLSAFPVDEDALADMGADKVLVKPMHTRQLLQQLEALYVRHHSPEKGDDAADAAPAEEKADDGSESYAEGKACSEGGEVAGETGRRGGGTRCKGGGGQAGRQDERQREQTGGQACGAGQGCRGLRLRRRAGAMGQAGAWSGCAVGQASAASVF